jgi:hypothetical protein
MTPGDRVVPLCPQALGTHFSRLLRHAWVTVELFFNPGHHTGLHLNSVKTNLRVWTQTVFLCSHQRSVTYTDHQPRHYLAGVYVKLRLKCSLRNLASVTEQKSGIVDRRFRGDYCRNHYHRPDDGGSKHLWNAGLLPRDHMVKYPRRLSSSARLCQRISGNDMNSDIKVNCYNIWR